MAFPWPTHMGLMGASHAGDQQVAAVLSQAEPSKRYFVHWPDPSDTQWKPVGWVACVILRMC